MANPSLEMDSVAEAWLGGRWGRARRLAVNQWRRQRAGRVGGYRGDGDEGDGDRGAVGGGVRRVRIQGRFGEGAGWAGQGAGSVKGWVDRGKV